MIEYADDRKWYETEILARAPVGLFQAVKRALPRPRRLITCAWAGDASKRHLISALQGQHLAGLVGGGDLQ